MDKRIVFHAPQALADAVNTFRHAQQIDTLSEAYRRLVVDGLRANSIKIDIDMPAISAPRAGGAE